MPTGGRRQEWLTVAMIWLQCLLLHQQLGDTASAVFFAVLACVAVFTRYRQPVSVRFAVVITGVEILVFLLKQRAVPYESAMISSYAPLSLIHVLAQFCLLKQAQLILFRAAGSPVSYLALAYGVLCLLTCGGVSTSGSNAIWYFVGTTLQTLLMAVFVGCHVPRTNPRRQLISSGSPGTISGDVSNNVVAGVPQTVMARSLRLRNAVMVGMLVVNVMIAGTGTLLLQRFWPQLERMLDFSGMESSGRWGSVGFSHRAELGQVQLVKSLGEYGIAMRVFGSRDPVYMRGVSFETLQGTRWESRTAHRQLSPVEDRGWPAGLPQFEDSRFVLKEIPAPQWNVVRTWCNVRSRGVLFHPLESFAIAVDLPELTVDEHGCIESSESVLPEEYSLITSLEANRDLVSKPPSAVSGRNREKPQADVERASLEPLLQIPKELEPVLRRLAAELTQGCKTTSQKITAIETHFRNKYRYGTTVTPPPGRNAIEWFLTERPAAHCEYFGSAVTLVLRAAGVPARYVHGFVVAEKNPIAAYWIARNRDAHAWSEAFDETNGWVTVEATPGGGVPESRRLGFFQAVIDDVLSRIQQIQSITAAGGWRGLLRGFWLLLCGLIETWPGRISLVAIVGWLSFRMLPKIRRLFSSARSQESQYHELHRLLLQADQQLNRVRVVRQPSETLHQFASRLAELANQSHSDGRKIPIDFVAWQQFYEAYAAVRYAIDSSADDVRNLAARLTALR